MGGWWNIFDFVLVALALYDTVFTIFLQVSTGSTGVMQSLRYVRLVRALRLFRLVQVFSETRMMFNCIIGCLFSLFSSCMMLCLILYLFSLLFVQTLSMYLMAEGAEHPTARSEIDPTFGSVQMAMFTLYRSISHGELWDVYYQVLHEHSRYCSLLFIFFIAFMQIGVFNIMSSIFFERAQQIIKPDTQTQMYNESMKQIQLAEAFQALCNKLDADGSGTISAEELKDTLSSESVWAEFIALGIDLHGCDDFFELLLQSNGLIEDVEIDMFVESCMRMRGDATCMNQRAMLLETKTLRNMQAEQNWREKHFQNEVINQLNAVVSHLNRKA